MGIIDIAQGLQKEAEGQHHYFLQLHEAGSGEGGADLFSLLSSYRMRGNGSKLPLGMFGLEKNFFTEEVVKHWNRLPRESVCV